MDLVGGDLGSERRWIARNLHRPRVWTIRSGCCSAMSLLGNVVLLGHSNRIVALISSRNRLMIHLRGLSKNLLIGVLKLLLK